MQKTETFSFNVNAKEPDAGVPVPISENDFSALKVTNNSGTIASYSVNGGATFTDLAAGAILTIGYGEKSQYLFRKKSSDWISLLVTVTYPALSDKRKLAKWFDGGISGKSVVLSGDSTTQQFQNTFPTGRNIYRDGRAGRIQHKYPDFTNTTVYARGEAGGTLTQFLGNSFTDNHRNDPTANYYALDTFGNIDAIIALKADLYVLCWGINDIRVSTAYTAAMLQADMTIAVNKIRAAVPKACIILRMPNAHATDNIGGIMGGGATAQNCMDRYQQGYAPLQNIWPDVLVWNSQIGLYPIVAPATAAGCPLINSDSLHPSVSAYDQTLDVIFTLATPSAGIVDYNGRREASLASPFKYNKTDNLLKWDSTVDAKALDGSDWYKVYRITFNYGTRGSSCWWGFSDFKDVSSATVAASAWTSGIVAQGLVPGDIISLTNKTGQAFTFVIKINPISLSGSELGWAPHPAGTWSAAETEDLIAHHPIPVETYKWTGYVYRHKYAHCLGMEKLKSAPASTLSYDIAVGTANNYAVSRRFYISATPALGAFTAQTIGSETGGDLSVRTWAVTDTVCIPGVTSGVKTGTAAEGVDSLGLTLTGATFTADTVNKRMAVTGVTSGGLLVDFSKYLIPQGYVLSAT